MQGKTENPFVPPPERAGELARNLCGSSLAWAKTVGGCLGRTNSELEDDLWEEILAFALCLVRLRLSAASETEREAFLALVRLECERLSEARSWRQRSRIKRLPAPACTHGGSQEVERAQAAERQSGAARVTQEMFEQFCHLTGLDSTVLVGSGENLASLMFYITIYGVVSEQAPLRTDEALRLLRAVRECRGFLEAALPGWLAEPSSGASGLRLTE